MAHKAKCITCNGTGRGLAGGNCSGCRGTGQVGSGTEVFQAMVVLAFIAVMLFIFIH